MFCKEVQRIRKVIGGRVVGVNDVTGNLLKGSECVKIRIQYDRAGVNHQMQSDQAADIIGCVLCFSPSIEQGSPLCSRKLMECLILL